MPSDSTSIQQEGAVFKSFKLVKNGAFQEEGKEREISNFLALPGAAEYLFYYAEAFNEFL